MQIAIIAFDEFTDIDVFFLWDLLNRVPLPDWEVRILGDAEAHTSSTGLRIPMHGHVRESADADAVLFASGKGVRSKYRDAEYLANFAFDPRRQLVGSMCSGALLLAALGLLDGKRATTYPSSVRPLRELGIEVVEEPFVREGNVATAAGCLAAQRLVGWVVETLAGAETRDLVLKSVQPVGEGLGHDDYDIAQRVGRAYRASA